MTLLSKVRRRVIDRTRWRLDKAQKAYIRHVGSRVNTRRDPATGLLFQEAYGHKIFLKSRRDYLDPALLHWLCRDIYFKFYEPSGRDVVVDVGAGYGHEAFYLLNKSRELRYFGIEVQPSVYESLCNSFRSVSAQCRAIGLAVAEGTDSVQIGSAENYTTASTVEAGYIEVPALPWNRLLARYGIGQIDLLKMNIEGAERQVLPAIGNMDRISRVIVSAHDFRADLGEGEQFRTREFVKNYLVAQGYQVRSVNDHDAWLRNWLYADRTAPTPANA
jgi:FkbM family methyltransferase